MKLKGAPINPLFTLPGYKEHEFRFIFKEQDNQLNKSKAIAALNCDTDEIWMPFDKDLVLAALIFEQIPYLELDEKQVMFPISWIKEKMEKAQDIQTLRHLDTFECEIRDVLPGTAKA